MGIRRLASSAVLATALALAACGAGSGRSGTDLAVTGSLATPVLLGGDPVVFVMTVTNRGEFEATGVQIRNATLQVSQSGLSITCSASGGATCPAATGPTMEVPVLPRGGRLDFEVRSTLNVGASGTFSNTMVVTADTTDIDSGNNSATVSGTVTSNDVAITATAPPGPLVAPAATFTMVVDNAGPDTARDVLLTTTASANLVFVPADVACVTDGGAEAPLPQTDGSLLVPSVPAGAQLVCSVPVVVVAGTSGVAVVSMTAASAGDGRAGNDTGTASVSATLVNDVSVTGTAPPGPLLEGPAVFTMVVANAGPAQADDVRLTTTASANLSLSPAAISCVGQGGAQAPTLQDDGSLLSAAIPAGAQLDCSIPVTVARGTSGQAVVSMTASAAGDQRPGNDTATVSVSATLVSDLNVAGSAAATSVPGGGATSFTFVVGNSGPATAFDVEVANVLGSGLSAAGAVSCSASGGATVPVPTVDGTLVASALPVGGVLTCTVPVTVDAGASGPVGTTFSASTEGETRPFDNTVTVTTVAVSTDLVVSQSGADEAPAGRAFAFVARINNAGPGPVRDLRIDWTRDAATGIVFETPTCRASAGAVCPAVIGPTMTVQTLESGRTLEFTFDVSTALDFRGEVSNTVAISAAGDTNPDNNEATATTRVVDPRNGSYEVFAADGRGYDLVVDFDGGRYTMSGNGDSVTRSFTGDASDTGDTGEFVVQGNERFRVATDLLVGGHDFGNGVLPYVAARSFAGSLAALAGSYNLATRIVGADGGARTLPGTAVISGNTLSVCESDTAEVPVVRLCPAGARKDYLNLALDGSVVTGIAGDGEAIRFSVAGSGGAKFLFSVGPTAPDAQRVRYGVVDSTGGLTFGPAQSGASTTGDWVTLTVVDGSPVTYTVTGGAAPDGGDLTPVNPVGGPFSMLTGLSGAYGGQVLLLQSFPLQILVGGAPAASPASGLLQLTLP
jgi:uncharacterized repeat protein (TIGR01451 family)